MINYNIRLNNTKKLEKKYRSTADVPIPREGKRIIQGLKKEKKEAIMVWWNDARNFEQNLIFERRLRQNEQWVQARDPIIYQLLCTCVNATVKAS